MLIDEKFYLAIAFVIFIALSYKSVKKFIVKFLDLKIIDIKTKFDNARKMEKDSLKNLMRAKVILQNTSHSAEQLFILVEKNTKSEVMKMNFDLEKKIKLLENNSIKFCEMLKHKKIAMMKNNIAILVYNKSIANLKRY